MSPHECWEAHMTPWHHAHDCFWALMSAHCSMAPSSWVFMASPNGFSWAIVGTHEHPLALTGTNKQPWVVLIANEHPWAAMNTWHHGTMNTQESSKMVIRMAPWDHGRSSRLMNTHGAIVSYSWVLVSTHESTCGLLKAHERSWQLLSADLLN